MEHSLACKTFYDNQLNIILVTYIWTLDHLSYIAVKAIYHFI